MLLGDMLQKLKNDANIASGTQSTDGFVQQRKSLLGLPRGTTEFQTRRALGGGVVDAFDAWKSLKLLRFTNNLKEMGHRVPVASNSD